MNDPGPELRAFWAAMREWEHRGEPQSGPVFDRLNQTREAFILSRQPETEGGDDMTGPGPGPVA